MELYEHLKRLEAADTPITVGLVGCGQMGSGFVHMTRQMPGMKTVAIADIDVNRPLKTYESIGLTGDAVCVTNDDEEAAAALAQGKALVTQDALLLTRVAGIDILLEATGSTEVGAKVAWNSIMNKKHVVMLNVETDVTVGPYLNKLAKNAGVVYTVASGDEPGECKKLYDFSSSLGFEVVCLGKGKNNPIDYHATPASCEEEARGKGMNPKMLAAFKDGSKTMVELAAMSNATGLVPDVPGAHGPKADLNELNKVMTPVEDGGVLSQRGCVEYTTGNVAPGVFVIITTDDPAIHDEMKFVAMGPGPYYMLYRPYHLTSIETPISVAEAVVYGEPTLVSDRMISEVVAIAKRDLEPGQVLDTIGGFDFYNRIYKYEDAKEAKGVPMGLTPGGTVLKPIKQDEMITYDNFAPDPTRFAYKLRQLQDVMLEQN
jgi:predicted homoserine dehydrogenase-like protein